MRQQPRFRANNLSTVMREQGRTTWWVAKQGGISSSLLSHVVAGRRTLSNDAARRISEALNVDLFHLFYLS